MVGMKTTSRILIGLGAAGMLIGSLDPMEGSLLILPGSGLVALGVYLGQADRKIIKEWLVIFALNSVGVSALWGVSAMGGIGGDSGHSWWWGLLIIPYLLGWLLGVFRVFGTVFGLLGTWWRNHRPKSGGAKGGPA